MIRIETRNLDRLVENHFKSVKAFFHRPGALVYTPTLYNSIDSEIKAIFIGWDFEKIIKAKPNELEKLIADFNSIKPNFSNDILKIPRLYDYFSTYQKKISQAMIDPESQEQYTAYRLIEKLGIKVCPYCNRNYIYNIPYTKKRTSEVDHFYPKKKYSFLAISFYNLIPSCKVCNFIKNKNNIEILNPYRKEYRFNEEVVFYIEPIYINNFINNSDYFDLRLDFSKALQYKQRYENANILFQIENIYKFHKDIVVDILRKAEIFTESYINELLDTNIFSTREELINLILNTDIFDSNYLNIKPLTKLTIDINKQNGFK